MELIEAALRGALHPAWLAGCEAALADSVPGYSQKPRQEQLKLLLQQCLHCDLNLCGSGALPAGVQVGQTSVERTTSAVTAATLVMSRAVSCWKTLVIHLD